MNFPRMRIRTAWLACWWFITLWCLTGFVLVTVQWIKEPKQFSGIDFAALLVAGGGVTIMLLLRHLLDHQ